MQVFSQYLRYGGVDVGAKMFGGVSEQELKAMDKEEIIIARSQTDISIEKMDLEVDFELVAKSFL
jgi:Argonaute siRNA chaperone (ARC) complex subunit Arb1